MYMCVYIIKTIIYTYNNYIYAYIYILTIKGLYYTFLHLLIFYSLIRKYHAFYCLCIHFDHSMTAKMCTKFELQLYV